MTYSTAGSQTDRTLKVCDFWAGLPGGLILHLVDIVLPSLSQLSGAVSEYWNHVQRYFAQDDGGGFTGQKKSFDATNVRELIQDTLRVKKAPTSDVMPDVCNSVALPIALLVLHWLGTNTLQRDMAQATWSNRTCDCCAGRDPDSMRMLPAARQGMC